MISVFNGDSFPQNNLLIFSEININSNEKLQ